MITITILADCVKAQASVIKVLTIKVKSYGSREYRRIQQS